MKKNLRALCLALVAVVCSTSFAQVQNVTNKMVNPDMEKGIIGWDLTFDSHVWKRQVKTQLTIMVSVVYVSRTGRAMLLPD